jgi:8-oxoguanine deaminase
MDDQRRILTNAGLFARDGKIETVGKSEALPDAADEVIDATDHVILPGLVNTHHHLAGSLTRCNPVAQDLPLKDWVAASQPLRAGLTPEEARAGARLTLAELLLSGCTTAFDHHNGFPSGPALDQVVEAAKDLGIRFMLGRGGQAVSQHITGPVPSALVETPEQMLADTERRIDMYHDPAPFSMCQIVVAPIQLFGVGPELARSLIDLARKHKVRAHTHLCESVGEFATYLERYGCRPYEFAEQVGWTGPDVWYAHGVHFKEEELERIGRAGGGIAHCPSSNMRLGSGIAPLPMWRKAGVKFGLAVDGSTSNDSSNMLIEARTAMLLQRAQYGADAMSAEQALEIATIGGAQVLGRDELGALAPDKAADFIGYNTRRREVVGTKSSDPVAALVFCIVPTVDLSVVNGAVRVRGGQLLGFDWEREIEEGNRQSEQTILRAEAMAGPSCRRTERPGL